MKRGPKLLRESLDGEEIGSLMKLFGQVQKGLSRK